ncbi:MAG: hypothetical protein WCR67_02210 [Bacilli bacterium]
MENTVKEKKYFLSEIIWYISLGIVWLTGLVFSILGAIAYNSGRITDNPLYKAQKGFAAAFGQAEGTVWDFRIFGAILMVVAMIFFLVVIFYFSDKKSKEIAAKKRKEERMRILMAGQTPVETPKETVEAETAK